MSCKMVWIGRLSFIIRNLENVPGKSGVGQGKVRKNIFQSLGTLTPTSNTEPFPSLGPSCMYITLACFLVYVYNAGMLSSQVSQGPVGLHEEAGHQHKPGLAEHGGLDCKDHHQLRSCRQLSGQIQRTSPLLLSRAVRL